MTQDNADEHLIQVTIFGQKYTLRGSGESSEIEKVAALVDHKMREIAEGTATVDSLKVAILAALNIADEYQRFLAQKEREEDALLEKTEVCCRILDAVLHES